LIGVWFSVKIPKLKKKISAYLLGEDGKITKQSLMSVGSILGTVAIGGALMSEIAEAKAKTCGTCSSTGRSMVDSHPRDTSCNSARCCHGNSMSGSYNENSYRLTLNHTHNVSHCSY